MVAEHGDPPSRKAKSLRVVQSHMVAELWAHTESQEQSLRVVQSHMVAELRITRARS